MAEYIEREAVGAECDLLIKDIQSCRDYYSHSINEVLRRIKELSTKIKTIPAADVVEVTRCKECAHWGGVTYGFVCRKFSGIETKICMHADDYCSYGERKCEND